MIAQSQNFCLSYSMTGIGNLAEGNPHICNFLYFIIFDIFLFNIFVSFSSNVVIHFAHPVLEFDILKPLPHCVYNS